MSAKSTSKTVGKIITYILIMLTVVAIIGVIARFTGGFTSDFKTVYISVDGKDVMTSSGGYKLSSTEPITVDVKYTFSSNTDKEQGYSVKVIPHVVENEDFDFTLNDDVYSFQAEKDLTKGFDIDYGATSFTIKPKGGLTATMQSVYPSYVVGDCEDKAYSDMFTLVVTSYNGESSVYLHFTIETGVTSIILDQSEILF